MAKQQITKGATSVTMHLFIQDAGVVTGEGLTGLAYNTAGLSWFYHRQGAGSPTSVTLATASVGTYSSGGFVEISTANMPGFYEIGIPNAALATGASHVSMILRGATDMVPVPLEIELISEDNRAFSGLKKNRAFTALPFVMFDSTNRLPMAGLTVTVTRLIDDGSFSAGTLSGIEDKGNGVYAIDGAAADSNGDYVTFRATATGADPSIWTIITVP